MALTKDNADEVIEWIESVRGRGSAVRAQSNIGGSWVTDGIFVPNTIPAELANGNPVTGVTALKVEFGCWIIRGTRDEFYPCPIEVFAEKYRVEAKAAN